MWCGLVWFGVVWCGVVWCGVCVLIMVYAECLKVLNWILHFYGIEKVFRVGIVKEP